MTDKPQNPLRLEPPVRRADEALGERLALLARASTPTPVRRRVSWRAPVAGLAIVVGTGGLAYGAQSVAHHIEHPAVVVPGNELSPSGDASSDAPAEASSPGATFGVGQQPSTIPSHRSADNGRHVGQGHAKGKANAPGHNGTAPGQRSGKTRGKSADAPGKTHAGPSGAKGGATSGATGNGQGGQSTSHGKKKGASQQSRAHGG